MEKKTTYLNHSGIELEVTYFESKKMSYLNEHPDNRLPEEEAEVFILDVKVSDYQEKAVVALLKTRMENTNDTSC